MRLFGLGSAWWRSPQQGRKAGVLGGVYPFRVGDAGGTVEATANAAAKATDLNALTTRVTNAEGVNTAQNTRLSTVETDVAGKASSQSVTRNRVVLACRGVDPRVPRDQRITASRAGRRRVLAEGAVC